MLVGIGGGSGGGSGGVEGLDDANVVISELPVA